MPWPRTVCMSGKCSGRRGSHFICMDYVDRAARRRAFVRGLRARHANRECRGRVRSVCLENALAGGARILSAWITLIAQRGAVRSLGDFALGMRIENAVAAYGLYVWKMLWPAGLAFYTHGLR